MIRLERFLFNCIFGLVIPIAGFLVFWWGSLLFIENDKVIMIAALSGLVIGLIISLFLILIRKIDIYNLKMPVLIVVYLFYNLGMFGFFMGVPVFHLLLGVIAGYYWTKRLIYHNGKTDYRAEISKISGFTAFVIGGVCMFSATIALISKSTPYDLKHMLHLPFDITQSLLISSVVIGGVFLILSQYWLTKVTMIIILKKNNIIAH